MKNKTLFLSLLLSTFSQASDLSEGFSKDYNLSYLSLESLDEGEELRRERIYNIRSMFLLDLKEIYEERLDDLREQEFNELVFSDNQ